MWTLLHRDALLVELESKFDHGLRMPRLYDVDLLALGAVPWTISSSATDVPTAGTSDGNGAVLDPWALMHSIVVLFSCGREDVTAIAARGVEMNRPA